MHGINQDEFMPIKSNINKYFDKYEGYISAHDYQRADDTELKNLADYIRKFS